LRRALAGEALTVTLEGLGFVFETHYAPIRDHEGEVTGVIGVATDITERKRAEAALQAARDEIESKVDCKMEEGRLYGLTFRETTVLYLMAAGKANKEIALQLSISPLTVEKHVAHILEKMGAASRTEASVRALKDGLLS